MYSRTAPYLSRLKERFLLTKPSSTKKTYHLSLDISSSELPYEVGDSVAVLPINDPEIIDQILELLSLDPKENILDSRTNTTYALLEFLKSKANLSRVTTPLFKLLCERGNSSDLLAPEKKGELSLYLQSHTLADLLKIHRPSSIGAHEICKLLLPLMPRFYSIASSPKVWPHEIHLTVAHVSYVANGQMRYGVGSHFLCDLAETHTTQVPIYIQPSNHFRLPSDPNAPIILIGPGTGIAPFRAFLQERLALQASGRNWVFFGERNRASDFYYQEFWTQLESQGRVRLDLAFSRDQKEKIYVQHKMWSERKSLWNWLQEGSFLYVCGDAEQMAKDVESTLHKIAIEEGRLSEEDARLYIKALRAEKRYLLDVY